VRALLVAAFTLAAAVAAALAAAGTPLSPVNGARTTSTPTLTWSLGPNEKLGSVLVTKSHAVSGGRLKSGQAEARIVSPGQPPSVTEGSTSYTFRTDSQGSLQRPLPAGTWYWQVTTNVTDDQGHITEAFGPVASFVVAATLSDVLADMDVQQQTAQVVMKFKTNSDGPFVVKCKTTYKGKTFGTSQAKDTGSGIACRMGLRAGLTPSSIVTLSATMTGPGGIKGSVTHRQKVYSAAFNVRGTTG
jgi:hypothetical protein